MNQQTTIFIIIAAAVLFVLLLTIKNNRDRKKFIKPDEDNDAVNEEIWEQHNHRDKV